MTRSDGRKAWRAEIGRYHDGVHDLGGPATAAALAEAARRCGYALPPSFCEFLASHDGGTLFHESYRIRSCLAIDAGGFGWEGEETLAFDPARADPEGEMPVVRFERGAGVRLTVGSRFDRWLSAAMLEAF